MSPWLLIPTHVAAMVAWALMTKWEVRRNADLIAADGAMNSLHEGFHRIRSFYRLHAAMWLSFSAALPLWHHEWAMAASMVGLLVLFGGYFLRVFNPALNVLRGKAEFYASVDPHAALFPDRLSVWIAKLCERETGISWTLYLSNVYESILNASLALTILIYVISLKLLCIWQ